MIRSLFPTLAVGIAALAFPFLSAATAAEPETIKVDLWDKDSGDGITLSKDKVKAGAVEFEIKNTSKATVHEFLITPWKGSIKALPYSDKEGQVREESLPQLAGVEDMKPGAEATLRLPLKPGHYAVFCNQAGHYKLGMTAEFTVGK
jgi:uncharacterized cupredoxin-like copper-binding protein